MVYAVFIIDRFSFLLLYSFFFLARHHWDEERGHAGDVLGTTNGISASMFLWDDWGKEGRRGYGACFCALLSVFLFLLFSFCCAFIHFSVVVFV